MDEKVIVLGASLPGMLVADYCARLGKSVTMVAGSRSRPSRAETGLGPQYLWATRDVKEYLLEIHGRRPALRTVEVFWSPWGKGSPSVYPTPNMVEDYFAKMNTRTYPCQGIKSFEAMQDGMAELRGILEASLAKHRVSVLHEDASEIDSDRRVVSFESGNLRYDRLYNTVDRAGFEQLCGTPIKCPVADTYFYTSPDKLHSSDHQVSLANRPWQFHYICDPCTPIFRASWSDHRNRWVYESRYRFEAIPKFFDGIHTMCAKIRGEVELPSRDAVRHVGRWAELDPELMVSDVITRLSEICA